MLRTMEKIEKIKEDLEQPLDAQAFHHTVSDETPDGQRLADALLRRSVMEEMLGQQGNGYLDRILQEQEAVRQHVNENNQFYLVHYYQELPGGKISVFFKKAIRKILYFLLQPVVDEQNRYNASVTQSLNGMYALMEKQTAVISEQQRELLRLKRHCAELEDWQEMQEKERSV